MKTYFFVLMVLVGVLSAQAQEAQPKAEAAPIVLSAIEEEKAFGLFEMEVLQDFVVAKEHNIHSDVVIVNNKATFRENGGADLAVSCQINALWDVHRRYPKYFDVDAATGHITIKKGTKLVSHFLVLQSKSPSLSWRFADSASSYDLTLNSFKISDAEIKTDRQLLELWNKILNPYIKISRAEVKKD
ncbi:MAG TPA: hypothetical protein VM901_03805 [Bdellovibrionota bacterium]|jgi:hypothetical protein|nr:hypothetical protein [Bdellovibrionota bacterium]